MRSQGENDAWWKLYGGLLVNICVGSIFAFGSFSSTLQERIGCTSDEAAIIGLAGDVGLWATFVPGFFRDWAGDRKSIFTGSILVAAGTLSTAIAVTARLNYAIVACTWFAFGHGCGWLYCVTLLSNVSAWSPEARGYVVGLSQAFFGLSGATFSTVYDGAIFAERRIVFFILITGSVILAVTAFSVKLDHRNQKNQSLILSSTTPDSIPTMSNMKKKALDATSLNRFHRLAYFVIAYLAFVIPAALADQRSWSTYGILVLIATLGPLLFLPEILAGNNRNYNNKPATLHQSRGSSNDDQPLTSESLPMEEEQDNEETSSLALLEAPLLLQTAEVRNIRNNDKEDTASNTHCFQDVAAVSSRHAAEFWGIFLSFGIIVGASVTTSNALTSLARSRESCHFASLAAASITLLTSSDAIARMVSGVVINVFAVDGNVVLGAGACFVAISHALFLQTSHQSNDGPYSSTQSGLFLMAAGITGLANGTAWTACPWLVAQRFGTKHYGANFGLVSCAAIVSALTFSKLVLPIGEDLVDDNPLADCASISDDDDHSCYGAGCYHTFHRVVQVAAMFALLCAIDLERRRLKLRVSRSQETLPFPQSSDDDPIGASSPTCDLVAATALPALGPDDTEDGSNRRQQPSP